MKTLAHLLIAGCVLFGGSCAVYVGPSLPNSNLKPGDSTQKQVRFGWDTTFSSTNSGPTYHLLNRSYHLHKGGVFITRLATLLR